jgi:hypothetical protein
MTLPHTSLLAAEITLASLGGLTAIAALIMAFRRWRGAKPVPFSAAQAQAAAAHENRLVRALVALDIFVNVLVLNGQLDETISTHSWRARTAGKLWGKVLCGWLNWIQPDHGELAAAGDLERAEERVAVEEKALKSS